MADWPARMRFVEAAKASSPTSPAGRPNAWTSLSPRYHSMPPAGPGTAQDVRAYFLALQYWLYHPFNDVNNKHESDWEMIQLDFAASDAASALEQDPTCLGYGHHEGVEVAEWSSVKLERLPAEVTLS